MSRICLACSLALILAGEPAGASPADGGAIAVSPGAADRWVEVASPCPTFSWSAVDGAAAYELALLDVSDVQSPRLFSSHRIEGAALSWTPSRDACLVPGRAYAWLVRADLGSGGFDDWSAPRRFRVPGAPSAEELAGALAVLERWQATLTGTLSAPIATAAPAAAERTAAEITERSAEGPDFPLASGVAAIRGEIADTTGNAYGLLGITNSPQGAGVVARNQSSGADLVLDGEAQGQPDTLLTQSGLDRPSASGATFNLQNSGSGALTLQVDGVAVDTALTPIPWSRLTSVPAGFADGVDNDTTYTPGSHLVLVGTEFRVYDGRESGLDADKLDGLHSEDLQVHVTGLCAPGQAMRGIDDDGIVVCYDMPAPPRIATAYDPENYVGQETSIAVGIDGFPVISHHDATDGALLVTKCNDPSCDGGNETVTRIDDTGTDAGETTSITIGSDGLPIISYFDRGSITLRVAKCHDAACSSSSWSVVDTWAGEYSSIAIGADGLPVISYFDNQAEALAVAKCNDLACTGGNETISIVEPKGVYAVGEFTSIAIGTNGFPVISYAEHRAAPLRVALCNDAACSGGNESIRYFGYDGEYTSIAIGSDGFPIISYADTPDYRLRVFKCTNAACVGGTETIVDADNAGRYSSIAIGTDGLPVISYRDENAAALKFVRCNDPACAGGNEAITTLDDQVNEVGWFTSIAIGSNGFPVISYHDGTAGTLKVAKCNSANCTW